MIAVLLLLSIDSVLSAPVWSEVPGGKLYGISGMVLLAKESPTEFLVVHDNWDDAEPRLGIVTPGSNPVRYRPLKWTTANPPDDLEAISSVPGKEGQFLALSSNGWLYPLTVSKANVAPQTGFQLSKLPPKLDVEGLSVQKLAGQLVIAWGHRGAGTILGQLYYGLLDLEKEKVTWFDKAEIKVDFPSPNDPHTRHIADLKIDENGIVWATATNDPDPNAQGQDKGPFVSAVYILGVLRASKESVQFEVSTQRAPLWIFDRKVEALELVPGRDGGIAFGAEDEDLGGWIYYK